MSLIQRLPKDLPASTTITSFLDAHTYPPINLRGPRPGFWIKRRMNRSQLAAQGHAFKVSLLESRKLLVNRTYFYSDNYLGHLMASRKRETKEALADLMRDEAVVPFLFRENSLDDDDGLQTRDTVRHRRWAKFVGEAGALAAVKLSWTSDQSALLGERFDGFVRALGNLDPVRLAQECGLPSTSTDELSRTLQTVSQLDTSRRWIGREEVYAYLMGVKPDGKTDPFTPQRVFKLSPIREAVRQVADVRYSTNLSDVLNRFSYRMTGVRSRSVLQADGELMSGAMSFGQAQYALAGRNLAAAENFLRDYSCGAIAIESLRIDDILAIRATSEWRHYTALVECLLDHDRQNLDEHPLFSYEWMLGFAKARADLAFRVRDKAEFAIQTGYRERLDLCLDGGLIALGMATLFASPVVGSAILAAEGAKLFLGQRLCERPAAFLASLRIRKYAKGHDSVSASIPVYRSVFDPDDIGRLMSGPSGSSSLSLLDLTKAQIVGHGALEHKDADAS